MTTNPRKWYNKSISTGGTVYQKGGTNFEVRRHSITRVIEVNPGKSVIVPLLHYHNGEPLGVTVNSSSKVTAQGTKVYANTAVQEGSTVKNLKLEIQVQPKTLSSSAILDFYTARIMTSFHDIAGGQIYGLEQSAQNDGKAQFSDEAGSPTTQEVSGTNGQDNLTLESNLNKTSYDLGDVVKHWWKGIRKNVIYGGQPVLYNRWEKVPSKVTRSNPGMFYGLCFMNDSTNTTSDDTDVLQIEIKEQFTEIPLVQ